MKIGVKTDVGMMRENNQDSYYVSPSGNYPLFIIADGMGGHKAGEIASEMAIKIISYNFTDSLAKSSIEDETIKNKIEKSIYEANSKIHKKSMEDERFSGMGTTVTLAYIVDDKIFIGHVGDSRAYLLRNGILSQITEDHSLVEELIRNGSISREEAKHHPQRNIITRAVGTSNEIKTDVIVEHKCENDILLLCTDGLTNMVDDDQIKDSLTMNEDIQQACEELVKISNDKGGFDNITVLAIKF
jgi:serine/threonine protein phosphatase PrpC